VASIAIHACAVMNSSYFRMMTPTSIWTLLWHVLTFVLKIMILPLLIDTRYSHNFNEIVLLYIYTHSFVLS
jgi:hypothetical protein